MKTVPITIISAATLFGCSAPDPDAPLKIVWEELFIEVEAYGAIYADFNNDGHKDLFTHGHDRLDNIRYADEDGRFSEQFGETLAGGDRHGCAATDMNGDALLDLYCTNGAVRGAGRGDNRLFMANPDKTFTRVEDHGAEDPFGRARHTAFINYDGDEHPDLYVTNLAQIRLDGERNKNALFRSTGDGRFELVETLASESKGAFCLEAVDWNGDGLDDLATCSLGNGPSSLLESDGSGDFTDIMETLSLRTIDTVWRDVAFADINDDGLLDMVFVTILGIVQIRLQSPDDGGFRTAHHMLLPIPNGPDTTFPERDFSQGLPVSVTVSDLNNDGHDDVYLVMRETPNGKGSKDVDDIVYFGPDWTTQMTVPAAEGAGYESYPLPGGAVLVLNAGPDWGGPIARVSMVRAQ